MSVDKNDVNDAVNKPSIMNSVQNENVLNEDGERQEISPPAIAESNKNESNKNESNEPTRKSIPNADEEYVRKFTSGQPIIDQHNPFKPVNRSYDDDDSTSAVASGNGERKDDSCDNPTSDDFITTEEVLKQSKYVKTYIKNPDPYFVYDPAVLARIKEELNQNNTPNSSAKVPTSPKKEFRKKNANVIENPNRPKQLPYKKCSKPNYPDLSNIKIKVGTKLDGSYFSLTEVKSNAKKFDECIKKKKFKAERDLDDDDDEEEHLTNSGSSNEELSTCMETQPPTEITVPNDGSFTNTINSEDFQKYLEKSGLVLAPRKLLNDATEPVNRISSKPNTNGANTASDRLQKSAPTKPTPNIGAGNATKEKKLRSSIFHRLLSNNIFASRRRTVPKETVPNTSTNKRIVLERSYNRPNDDKIVQRSLIPTASHGMANSKGALVRNPVQVGGTSTNKHSKEASNQALKPSSPQNAALRPTLRTSRIPRDLDSKRHHSLPQNTKPPTGKDTEKLVQRDFPDGHNLQHTATKPNNGSNSVLSEDFRKLYQNASIANKPPTTMFQRSNSLGSKAISSRTREMGNMRRSREDNINPRANSSCSILFSSLGPGSTSTPKKKDNETPNSIIPPATQNQRQTEWMRLRKMKENVDRQIYSKIIKPKPSNNENLYEHLELRRQSAEGYVRQSPEGNIRTSSYISLDQGTNFVRGAQNRNTFCGTTRDRKYADFLPSNVHQREQEAPIAASKAANVQYSVRPGQTNSLKPYHTITREEIIQRVQQFCRNSMRKLKSQTEATNGGSEGTKLSPVSYVSVETQNEPAKHGPHEHVHIRSSSLNGSKEMIPTFVRDQKKHVFPLKNKEIESLKSLNAAGGPWKRNAQCVSQNIYVPDATSFQKRTNLQSEVNTIPRQVLQPRVEQTKSEEDWQNENKAVRQQSNEQANDERRRTSRREDPRRHTMGGDMLQYGTLPNQPQQRSMDLEMGMGLRTQKNKKNQPIRSYAPVNQGPLFDEDPGIMSEVETASTGFRRGGKQRSSLPVVRTPSKTLERPLGLVFLQYRSETKRALLPNEITSIDTVRALFVRSFPRQLTMVYLEGPNVKIYIHDPSKDMFYELEDVRSHLREIRDRSVLRLFESNEVAAPPQVLPGGTGIPQQLPQPAAPVHWDQDQSYFSEPEFDSEYQHQHIHKSKPGKQAPYYVGTSQTLPRGMYSDCNKMAIGAPAKPLRSYGSRGNMGNIFPYPPDQLYSIPDGYTSSPERGTRGSYEEPYYSQYGTRANVVAPIIDEENSEVAIPEDQYALYGIKVGPGRIPRSANQMYDPTRPEDLHRIRVEHMERQLANLTGLVQKALVNQNPQIAPVAVPTLNPNYLGVPAQCRANGTGEEIYVREKAPKLGKSSCHKSVSFEKSVSFSDDIQGVPKSHSPQHAADTKPTKPAIKSSTLPRTSSQERDRLKPPPPPKPIALTQTHSNYRADIALAPEVYNHLRGLQKKAKDLRMEVRTLRRLSQAQAVAVREDIKDAFMRIRATLLASSGYCWDQQADQEKTRISREEELYKQEVIRLEKDLSDLESSVEGLRGEVINRRTRVNMAAVEDMALVLSRASKTVAELKMRFPSLSNGVRNLLSTEMEKVVREEKFLKEEPDRLESALRRCKKLTGTLVTLKRLASVQEQRLPPNEPIANEEPPRSAEISTPNKQPIPSPRMGPVAVGGGIPPENALDALLDELQTFAKPNNQNLEFRPDDSTSDDSSQAILNTVTTQIPQACLFNPNDPNAAAQIQMRQELDAHTPANSMQIDKNLNSSNMLQVNANVGSLRRLHSYPSGSDTDTSPPQHVRLVGKPPVPERNAELLSKVGGKRIPPPPPPRTSSRSPLASPTSPNVPHRMPSVSEAEPIVGNGENNDENALQQDASGNSSGNESGNDQAQRQVALERRHQELLKKQKMLQEQYQRLQQMSKMPAVTMPPPPSDIMQLKKTGSESNLPQKMGLCMATATGSMKNLNTDVVNNAGLVTEKNEKNLNNTNNIQNLVKAEQLKEADGPKGAQSQLNQNEMVGNNVTTIKQVYETEIL